MKRILLSGAHGGLGQVVLKHLMDRGWPVMALAGSKAGFEALKSGYPDLLGQQLRVLQADITREDEMKKILDSGAEFGGLVHLAGGFRGAKSIGDSTTADLDFLEGLHIRATFWLLKLLVPLFKQNREGVILTIGAKPALHPMGENALYAASKAAEIALTLAVAEEGRPYHIRANCIVPAIIRTPENEKWARDGEAEKWTPPSSIAELIGFLLSEQGKGISGAVIPMYQDLPA